jgi:hypothetical protein
MAMKQRKEPKEEHEATAPKGDVSLRGGDPDGNKNSFDSCQFDDKVFIKATTVAHDNLHSTSTVLLAEERTVNIMVKARQPQPVPEGYAANNEGQEDDQVYRRQLQEQRELLAAVHNHIWCI